MTVAMQMGYDFNAARQAGESTAGPVVPAEPPRAGDGPRVDSLPVRHPDWASLRARFLAIHALRQAVAPVPVASPAGGGFASAGESVLSVCRDNGPVNPVYWANLKEDSAITRPVVASPTRGDRGMA